MATRILSVCAVVVVCVACAVIGDDHLFKGAASDKASVARDSANQIESELQQTTNFELIDEPLEEALNYISEQHHIRIWIDKQSIQDEGINSDTQVSLRMSGITLDTALRLLLAPLAMTHVTEDGVLKITTQAKAAEMMSTRVFPVADLVISTGQGENYGSLMQAVTQGTSGKWSVYDGEGGTIIPVPNSQSLVIRQTEKVHREIEGLLAALRKAKQLQHIRSIPINLGDTDRLNHILIDPSRPNAPTETWRRPRIHAAQ